MLRILRLVSFVLIIGVFSNCKKSNNAQIAIENLPIGTDVNPLDTFTSVINIDLLSGTWIDTATYEYGFLQEDSTFLFNVYTDIEYQFSDNGEEKVYNVNGEVLVLNMANGVWSFSESSRTINFELSQSNNNYTNFTTIHILEQNRIYCTQSSISESGIFEHHLTRFFIKL